MAATNPAAKWRILAQGPGARRVEFESDHVEFDEIVISPWLHLERMDARSWSLIVETGAGEQVMWSLRVRRDGTAEVTCTEGARHVRVAKGAK